LKLTICIRIPLSLLILGVAVVVAVGDDLPPTPQPVAVQQVAPKYELVWSDEFNTDGAPNPRNWSFERGFMRNDELQWYQPENARCMGGMLIIEARREQVENSRYDSDSRDWRRNRQYAAYTSASLNTRRNHQWLFGRFEMRGRIDVRPGMWPAFWTLGIERGWPAGGEVDIMEYYSGTLLANAAWLGRRGQARWDDFKRPITEFEAGWAKKFHNWRMDWNHDFIRLYVDDEELNEVPLDRTFNSGRRRANPFREPHYILLNLAIGGTRGGDPSGTEFPARFEVDYVRVYQEKAEPAASSDEVAKPATANAAR
jgi:beta-glucanase (GH16 family)